MSLKASVLATVGLFLVVLAVGFAILFSMPLHRAERHAESLGGGLGFVTTVGAAAIWLPFAVRRRKKNLAAAKPRRAQQKRPERARRSGR